MSFQGKLTCVEAYDPDEGNNGRILYLFDHFDDKLTRFLYLNNETGCLFIIQPLLLTSIDLLPLLQLNNHLLLTIRAQDCGSRMSSTLPVYHPLELIIEDVNDHEPSIQVRKITSSIDVIQNNSKMNIKENTTGLLAMVTVNDIDQGIYGQVQLTLIVRTLIRRHRLAFQLKRTSAKHYKVRNFSFRFLFCLAMINILNRILYCIASSVRHENGMYMPSSFNHSKRILIERKEFKKAKNLYVIFLILIEQIMKFYCVKLFIGKL